MSPEGIDLPVKGFDVEDNGFLDPSDFVSENIKIEIKKTLNVFSFLSLLQNGMAKTFWK